MLEIIYSRKSSFIEGMGGVSMSENLDSIINFINDNFLYGSRQSIRVIENLLFEYPVFDDEKKQVFDEIESLNIELVYSKQSLREQIKQLFDLIGAKKSVNKSSLLSWFMSKNIGNELQEKITEQLVKNGYEVIVDKPKSENDEFDFLDDDDYDLDALLDDRLFQEEVASYQDVIDKSKNFEYLSVLHSDRGKGDVDNALSNLVEANSKLVWKIVMKYKTFSTAGLDVNDMYQAGVQGLLKAAKKFDLSKGNQFSTYATWWIRQGITREIYDYGTTIRIPVHMRERINKLASIQREFWHDFGRNATDKELSELMSLPEEKIIEAKHNMDLANLTTSLDVPIGAEETSYLGDFISDDKTNSPGDEVEREALKSEITEIMEDCLTPREMRVLSLRFGLVDGKTYTLENIGELEKVTRERIRQIESKALRKLRRNHILERLRDFYED